MNSEFFGEFVRREVPDWDDEVVSTARFKAFSGQRSDWEQRYHFWRDLILKVARRFGFLIIRPSQVKKEWFNRGGLTPLCIEDVLLLMYNEGEIIRRSEIADPTSGRLALILKKVKLLMFRPSNTQELFEDSFVLTVLLQEKACEVIKQLSESNWTSSCILTLKKFQVICGGPDEASIILSHLSGSGKALYLSVIKKEVIEGVKISISSAAVPSTTTLDYDILHLISTAEKLQQQLDVIDQRHEKSRNSAIAFLKAGNKKAALRYARELKLASESREKCASLLHRVEEVLAVIWDAESTKTVSEAIQIGARAMKESKISIKEVELCLEDIDESIVSQKQVEEALGLTSSTAVEDEDVEDEFRMLELEIDNEDSQAKNGVSTTVGETSTSESASSLSDVLANLKLVDRTAEKPANDSIPTLTEEEPRNSRIQAEAEAA